MSQEVKHLLSVALASVIEGQSQSGARCLNLGAKQKSGCETT